MRHEPGNPHGAHPKFRVSAKFADRGLLLQR